MLTPPTSATVSESPLDTAYGAGPDGGGGFQPSMMANMPGLRATGRSGAYGPIFEWGEGGPSHSISLSHLQAMMRDKYGQLDPEAKKKAQDEMNRWMRSMGMNGGFQEDGQMIVTSMPNGKNPDGSARMVDPAGRPVSTTRPTGGATSTGGSSGGGSRPSGGGSSGGGGGSSSSGGGASGSGYNYTGGGNAGAPQRESDLELVGGAPGNGPTRIDPNRPLGLDPSHGAPAGFRGGSGAFGAEGAGVFPGPGSVLEGIGPNSTLNDVIMNIVKRQEANRDAALAIYGGTYRNYQNDPTLQGARGRAQELLANPFSLDDQTVDRIMGRQQELIGQNYQRLGQQAADRAAASGVGRSGLAQAQQDRFAINAQRDLGNTQRGLLVEQATRRPQELAQAVQVGGGFGQSDVSQGAAISTGAANQIHGNTSIMGDALLSGVLMGGGPPPINIAHGPDVGPIGSRYGVIY